MESEKLIITFKGEVLFVEIVDDDQQHMLSVIVEPEGMDLYLDGTPVDPTSGKAATGLHSTELLEAADVLVRAWEAGGDTVINVRNAMLAYQLLRGGNSQSQRTREYSIPEPVIIPDPPLDENWPKFLAETQRKFKPGANVPCPCGELIVDFPSLKEHYSKGHFKDQPASEQHPARGYMPQKEGPSTD